MEFINKTLEKLNTVNLRGGIFGKTTNLLIVLILCVTSVCLYTKIWWIALILMLPLMAMVFYAIKRCFDFAENNPQAAIMEGAELLSHEQLMFAQKNDNSGVNPMLEETVSDHTTITLNPVSASYPDEQPSEQLPESTYSTNKEN